MTKTLDNTTANQAAEQVPDIKFWGNGNLFKLLSKASSEKEGWMKSTKAMYTGTGCVVQTTTQQRNPDGSYALTDAITFVPGVKIVEYCRPIGNNNEENQVILRDEEPVPEGYEVYSRYLDGFFKS